MIPDQIEVGTYRVAAAAVGGEEYCADGFRRYGLGKRSTPTEGVERCVEKIKKIRGYCKIFLHRPIKGSENRVYMA